jgi:hypothetical protein
LKRPLAIVSGALGMIWLLSIGVIFFYVAGLVNIAALLGAVVAQIAVFLVTSALLLTTNTRRPAGIDPNAPLVKHSRDPFSQTTDELRGAVLLPDSRPYGRRISDDRHVVERLIDRLEKDDEKRPAPVSTPQWALDLQQMNGGATPQEGAE